MRRNPQHRDRTTGQTRDRSAHRARRKGGRLTDIRDLSDDALVPTAFVDDVERSLKERWASESYGLQTGFSQLEQLTTGLLPGKMVVIAARPSVGNTSFDCNIAENVFLTQSRPVIFFSCEMSRDEILIRILTSARQFIICLSSTRTRAPVCMTGSEVANCGVVDISGTLVYGVHYVEFSIFP